MSIKGYEDEMEEIKPVESLAQKLYNKQVKSIVNISHTNGYSEIKAYWKTINECAKIELESISKEHLEIVQMKCNISNGFLAFLQNLEDSVKK